MSNYTVKILEDIKTKPGCWNYQKVGVFDNENHIGEYTRNYSGHAEKTFYPFESKGKWYALYSKHYMYTRLMSLPDCGDLGGEDKDNTEYKNHFCPVEYFVPEVTEMKSDSPDPRPYHPQGNRGRWGYVEGVHDWKDIEKNPEYQKAVEKYQKELEEWNEKHPFETFHADFGLVAGCIWGDDWAWQIQYLDLSKADQGIVKRDRRFGDIYLPRNVQLKDAIYMMGDGDCDRTIEIAIGVTFDMDGKNISD